MKTTTLLLLFFCLVFTKTNAQFAYTRDIKDSATGSYMYDLIVTDEDNSMIASSTPGNNKTISVSKLNNKGNGLWSKTYSYFDYFLDNGLKMIQTENEGFVGVTTADGTRGYGPLIFKADSNGNILWAKRIKAASKGYYIVPLGIAYSKDKNVYLINEISDYGISVQKLDEVGNPVWNKYFYTDSIAWEISTFAFAISSSDNGLIISETSSIDLGNTNYNHLFKFSKDGIAEWEYTTQQSSEDYTYGQNAFENKNGRLNILYLDYLDNDDNFIYSILDPKTGKSVAYSIGLNIFDVQLYLKNNSINSFNDITFPYNNSGYYSIYAFTKNFSFIQAMKYQPNRRTNIARIQRFDSIGRICPTYQIPSSQYRHDLMDFKFIKSSFKLTAPPTALNIVDTIITVTSANFVTNICAGKPPSFSNSSAASNTTNASTYKLNIFPNPVKNEMNMVINVPSTGITKIDIINMDGSILKSEAIILMKGTNNKTINMSGIAVGVYTVKLSSASGLITQKIIKQ